MLCSARMDQSTTTPSMPSPTKRKRGRPPIPEDQRKAGFHLQVRPEVRLSMIALAEEHGITVGQLFETIYHVAAGFAAHPDGARLLRDHATARDFGIYVASKVADRQTVVIEGISEFDGVLSGMIDVAKHLAEIEAAERR